MPTTVITVPPTLLSVGTHGPFATGSNITLNPAGYLLTFTNTADWPTSGDVALITVELSLDGGHTWQFDASCDFGPGPWQIKGAGNTNQSFWSVNQPPAANRLRATIQMFQAATLGVTVTAQ